MAKVLMTWTRDDTSKDWVIPNKETIDKGIFSKEEIDVIVNTRNAYSYLPGYVTSSTDFIDDYSYTFTLEFDTDYKLDKNKYKTNAPDLVIISPKVIAEKPIIIDLSCENIPGYPDNSKKAKNGYRSGENGYDGKPGLPGYNAGNLIILADSILNISNLQTNLIGGTGGPGQDGIRFF